jgi:hypothetical protein
VTKSALGVLSWLLVGCSGLVPTRRYVVEPSVVNPATHTIVWYEHVSGPGVGVVPGDEEVHVVLCNERLVPPCVRLEIEDVDVAGRRAILDRLEALRSSDTTTTSPPPAR